MLSPASLLTILEAEEESHLRHAAHIHRQATAFYVLGRFLAFERPLKARARMSFGFVVSMLASERSSSIAGSGDSGNGVFVIGARCSYRHGWHRRWNGVRGRWRRGGHVLEGACVTRVNLRL